jgi:hypothetical protein
MIRITWLVRAVMFAALVAPSAVALGQDDDAKAQAALIKALQVKHIDLAAGITAATAKGKPISSQYEYEDNHLQLSVFTQKGDDFTEIFVDFITGKIAKAEKITDGADLADARAQGAAMAKAKSSLSAVLTKVLAANAGYSAVSATASHAKGKAVVFVVLMKGATLKTISEPLT